MEKLKENWKRIIEEKEGYFITKIYKEIYREEAEKCISEAVEILLEKSVNIDGYGFMYIEDIETREFIVNIIPKPGEKGYKYYPESKKLIEIEE